MGLFRKQIDKQATTDYFSTAYTEILSPAEELRHTNQLRQLTETAPILRLVKQHDFIEELNAVNAAWLSIAWSKYYFSRVDMMTAIHLMSEIESRLNSTLQGFTECKSLADFYGDTFGGSTDGNTDMAYVFVRNILKDFDQAIAKRHPKEFNDAVQIFSYLFIGIYDDFRASIKSHRLIH